MERGKEGKGKEARNGKRREKMDKENGGKWRKGKRTAKFPTSSMLYYMTISIGATPKHFSGYAIGSLR